MIIIFYQDEFENDNYLDQYEFENDDYLYQDEFENDNYLVQDEFENDEDYDEEEEKETLRRGLIDRRNEKIHLEKNLHNFN